MERKQEILHAALGEFVRNGVSGARMQSIADEVGVTKAMIHYYFDTKEKLFREVFGEACRLLFGNLMKVLETDVPLFHKIDQFIIQALEQFQARPALAGFVVTELNRNPAAVAEFLRQETNFNPDIFDRQLEAAASNYEIAPVKSEHVLVNMVSLCLFPCTGHGLIKELLHMENEQEYDQFLKQRSTIVSDTIINWLAS